MEAAVPTGHRWNMLGAARLAHRHVCTYESIDLSMAGSGTRYGEKVPEETTPSDAFWFPSRGRN